MGRGSWERECCIGDAERMAETTHLSLNRSRARGVDHRCTGVGMAQELCSRVGIGVISKRGLNSDQKGEALCIYPGNNSEWIKPNLHFMKEAAVVERSRLWWEDLDCGGKIWANSKVQWRRRWN